MPDRFALVSSNLFRGGAPSYEDLRLLSDKLGIERIISLDGEVASDIHSKCNLLDLEHVVLPIDGGNPTKNIDKIYKIINNLDKKKTYIHCLHGKDRTGMVCAMYRISKGMGISEALTEAYEFGMGSEMPVELKNSYYKAVIDFSNKTEDSNSSADIGDLARDEMHMNNIAPSINNYQISSPNQMSFAPFSDPSDSVSPVLNVTAGIRLFVLSTSIDVLKPQQWFTRTDIFKQLNKKGLKLYSAEISSNANIVKYRDNYSKSILNDAILNNTDIVFFSRNVIFVLNPSALINIREEDGSDTNAADIPQIGMKSNYTGLAPYSFPGSGGFMESGYGGFAGVVQLPLQDYGE